VCVVLPLFLLWKIRAQRPESSFLLLTRSLLLSLSANVVFSHFCCWSKPTYYPLIPFQALPQPNQSLSSPHFLTRRSMRTRERKNAGQAIPAEYGFRLPAPQPPCLASSFYKKGKGRGQKGRRGRPRTFLTHLLLIITLRFGSIRQHSSHPKKAINQTGRTHFDRPNLTRSIHPPTHIHIISSIEPNPTHPPTHPPTIHPPTKIDGQNTRLGGLEDNNSMDSTVR
jgi:hypothetical protein